MSWKAFLEGENFICFHFRGWDGSVSRDMEISISFSLNPSLMKIILGIHFMLHVKLTGNFQNLVKMYILKFWLRLISGM